MRQVYSFQSFTQGAYLVQLDQNGITDSFFNSGGQAGRVSYKEIVTDKLHLLSQGPGQSFPAGPVFFAKAVFNADNRVTLPKAAIVFDQLFAGIGLPFELVTAVLKQLRGGHVERQVDILSGKVAGGINRFGDHLQGGGVRLKIWCKTALIADRCTKTAGREYLF